MNSGQTTTKTSDLRRSDASSICGEGKGTLRNSGPPTPGYVFVHDQPTVPWSFSYSVSPPRRELVSSYVTAASSGCRVSCCPWFVERSYERAFRARYYIRVKQPGEKSENSVVEKFVLLTQLQELFVPKRLLFVQIVSRG